MERGMMLDDDPIVYVSFAGGGSAEVYRNQEQSTFDIRVQRWGGLVEVTGAELLALGEELVRLATERRDA
jgi:hypothetical protein